MTEKLLTGTLSLNTTNQVNYKDHSVTYTVQKKVDKIVSRFVCKLKLYAVEYIKFDITNFSMGILSVKSMGDIIRLDSVSKILSQTFC